VVVDFPFGKCLRTSCPNIDSTDRRKRSCRKRSSQARITRRRNKWAVKGNRITARPGGVTRFRNSPLNRQCPFRKIRRTLQSKTSIGSDRSCRYTPKPKRRLRVAAGVVAKARRRYLTAVHIEGQGKPKSGPPNQPIRRHGSHNKPIPRQRIRSRFSTRRGTPTTTKQQPKTTSRETQQGRDFHVAKNLAGPIRRVH
jgi:hypothetical protein